MIVSIGNDDSTSALLLIYYSKNTHISAAFRTSYVRRERERHKIRPVFDGAELV